MNSQNNITTLVITFFDSTNLSKLELEDFKQCSYVFFEKYLGKSRNDIVDQFIENGITIRYTNDKIKLSSILGKFFMEDPWGCVSYMNSIVRNVVFKYANGGIEVYQGGGPGSPTRVLIGKNKKAANDAIFAEAA